MTILRHTGSHSAHTHSHTHTHIHAPTHTCTHIHTHMPTIPIQHMLFSLETCDSQSSHLMLVYTLSKASLHYYIPPPWATVCTYIYTYIYTFMQLHMHAYICIHIPAYTFT